MKNNYPTIVCWRITSKCNRSCPFCFRPKCQDLNTKQVYKIIDNLAIHGVKGIGITGGEPLLRKDIVRILKYIWDKNIRICLATNADFYSKYQKFINKYVAAIGIPIEGSTKEIHESLRGINNFHNVIDAIDKIYKKGKIQMYFTTVITKNNIEDLANIENLLAKYRNRIIFWKIYDIINYPDRPFQSMKRHGISKIIIKEIINNLGKKLGKRKILYLSSSDRSGASFLINPDGGAIAPINNKAKTKDAPSGNLLKGETNEIFRNWNKIVDYNKYTCHKCALKCIIR
ncbi:MAG: radical SAM protein [Candidatus Azambacteria bacterium]|nr:radical SAM protein [Candidatus Azambacteria bacterium]